MTVAIGIVCFFVGTFIGALTMALCSVGGRYED